MGGRRKMVVPMGMGGGAAVPMDVDVAGQQRGVAAQRGVEPVVRRRQLMFVQKWGVVRVGMLMMAVPGDRVVRMAVTMHVSGVGCSSRQAENATQPPNPIKAMPEAASTNWPKR